MKCLHLVFVFSITFLNFSFATEKLILFGGGALPTPAVQRFKEWSQGKAPSKYVVCPWASEDPEGALSRFKEKFSIQAPDVAELLPKPTLENLEVILKSLYEANGVFFSGGDQGLIANFLDSFPPIKEMMQKRFHAGVVFAGTSAGTAIMAETMVTGDGDFTVIQKNSVITRPGLGLLRNVLIDQHFIKRQRQNRLFSLLLHGKEKIGVGVDEDSAISILDNRWLEMLGPSYATVLEAGANPTEMKLKLLQLGERYDLARQFEQSSHFQ